MNQTPPSSRQEFQIPVFLWVHNKLSFRWYLEKVLIWKLLPFRCAQGRRYQLSCLLIECLPTINLVNFVGLFRVKRVVRITYPTSRSDSSYSTNHFQPLWYPERSFHIVPIVPHASIEKEKESNWINTSRSLRADASTNKAVMSTWFNWF